MTLREIDFVCDAKVLMHSRGLWRGTKTRIDDIRRAVEECACAEKHAGVDENVAVAELMRRAGHTTTLEGYR